MKNLKFLVIVLIALTFSCKSDKKGGSDYSVTKSDSEDIAAVRVSDEEMKRGSEIYFDRCAGCHGSSRLGATGTHLLPVRPEGSDKPGTLEFGTDGLKAFIENGTPGGMPEWKGIMTDEEIELMTRFLQVDPPVIPPYGIGEITNSWNLIVPVADRPTKPEHNRNIDNYERCW